MHSKKLPVITFIPDYMKTQINFKTGKLDCVKILCFHFELLSKKLRSIFTLNVHRLVGTEVIQPEPIVSHKMLGNE